jgi:serine/threonine-protein kinase
MFNSEAALSARLDHPNIVHVSEYVEEEGECFLVMEYLRGVNLSDVLKQLADRDELLPIGMAVDVVREICLALAYAHGLADDEGKPLGIIHRDVSPSNAMIGFDGRVKLLDFGIAKALNKSDDHTRTGSLKGKFSYMSPEAVDSEVELDARTDIFAAGIVLHELLTGSRLFKGRDDLHTISLVRACKIDPPSASRPEIPPELDRITMKALARDRSERYQTASALASDLGRLQEHMRWDEERTAAFLKAHELEPLPEDPPADPDATATPEMAAREAATVAAKPGGSDAGKTGKTGKTGGQVSASSEAATVASPGSVTGVARPAGASRTGLVFVLAAVVGVLVAAIAWRMRPRRPDPVVAPGPAPAASPVASPPVVTPVEPAVVAPAPAAPAIEPAPVAPVGPAARADEPSEQTDKIRPGKGTRSRDGDRGRGRGEGSERGERPSGESPPRPRTRSNANDPKKPPPIDLKRGDVLKTF